MPTGTAGTMGMPASAQATGRNPLAWIVGLLLVVIIVGGGAFLLVPNLTGGSVDATPTPPPGSQRISTGNYAISLPNSLLLPNPARRYTDASDSNRLLHVYRTENENDVYVSVALVTAGTLTVNGYSGRYYDEQRGLTFIDEEVAENGDIRRSYRVDGYQDLANGQIDVFYIEQNSFLAVVEMYTSDAAADGAQIAALQTILDSVRINGNEG